MGEVAERFELVRRLGAGGFGVVYEAFDRQSRQRIALKTMSDRDPTKLYMFKREFRALADVHHNNIVRLHEMIVAGDEIWLAMELVEGRDFLEWIWNPVVAPISAYDATAEGPVAISTVRRSTPPVVDFDRLRSGMGQLATGVEALHQRNILHRDLKPSNVLVDRNDRVVLLDFGIAKDRRGDCERRWSRRSRWTAAPRRGRAARRPRDEASRVVCSRATRAAHRR